MPALAARQAEPPSGRRTPCWNGTPEVYFGKHIDNSRVVKMDDPQRGREMRIFSIALACFCLLALSYAWQHFKSIEFGYRIAELKVQRDNLQESNRALHLEEASLRSPDRIDKLAKDMGMVSPQPGQVLLLDTTASETAGPVMASAAPVSVVSAR